MPQPKDKDGLTDKQKRFGDEYLVDLNASQAAIRAGYKENNAGAMGHENLQKPEIQAYISKKQLELQQATGITTKRVLEEYAKIAFLDIRKAYTVDGALKAPNELDDDLAGAIGSIESYEERVSDKEADENIVVGVTKKIKVHDKIRALDSLGRHLGIFEKDNKQKEIVIPSITILPPNEH